MLKTTTAKILQALMRNSKLSDRKIADSVGVSQPTVTRQRTAMKKSGVIQGYITIPDLSKIGFEIEAYSIIPQAQSTVNDLDVIFDKRVVFAKKLDAFNKIIVISVHKNYANYATFADKYSVADSFLALASRKPMKSFGFGDIDLET